MESQLLKKFRHSMSARLEVPCLTSSRLVGRVVIREVLYGVGTIQRGQNNS